MTDMNSLANALVSKPEELTPIMTHLGGREDKKFPLTMLTEGVKNTKSIDGLEYEYRVQTRLRKTRPIAVTNAGSNLGLGGNIFSLTFPDKWFINPYVLISPSGTQVRIQAEPIPDGSNYTYRVKLVNPDPTATLAAADAAVGATWGQMFAPVGTDFSRGNASNWQSPEKIRHKLTTIRKSYSFSGNAKNQVVVFELPAMGGKTTKLWMDYEEWQYYLQWKEECESLYWYANQSYNENGATQLRDENGQPVIIGPGLLEQVINKDTYSTLTANKLKNTIGDLFYGMTDAQNKQVTVYTGIGGAREMDDAMKNELTGFRAFNDGKFVSGSGRNMVLSGFFTTYEHVDGHTVRIVKVPQFDHGTVAQASTRHPLTGYSLESYRMVFVDQSSYDGESNLTMINQKGREMKRWAVAGSTIPKGYGDSMLRASDVDGASVHFLKTAGILLRRFDTSVDLSCVAS